jgi:hypothetical protein
VAEGITFDGTHVAPGRRKQIELPVGRLPSGGWMPLILTVLCGKKPGPCVWLNGVLHGDELNGLEIIRRVLDQLDPRHLAGTVIAAPIVNSFGFVQQERYLPDRRDLNRSFPGSPRGSLAGRLAHLFTQQVVRRCSYGLDFHTGSLHRENLPQVRGDLDHPEIRRLATTFGAPVMVHAKDRSGSLRSAASRLGVPVLVYEGGEPMRFSEPAIRAGVDGALRVLAELGLREGGQPAAPATPSREVRSSNWVRASRAGIVRRLQELGSEVRSGGTVGYIVDPVTGKESRVRTSREGIVIGRTNNPLVYQGDALLHVAQ